MVRKLFFFVCAVMYIVSAMTANAAPLPAGTILKITPGVGSGFNTPCIVGSCFAQVPVAGFRAWTDLQPGTDGGFIVGKSQASGGQEISEPPSACNPAGGGSPCNSRSGELTAANTSLLFGGNYGTLYTLPDGSSNVFDDASCTKAACIGKTVLSTFNIAWNGGSFPIGSRAGCTHSNCSADQRAGIFVSNYSIDLVGKTWSMEYSQVISSGGFVGYPTHAIFRGTVVLPQPNCPVVGHAWVSPTERTILVFGSNLLGASGVKLDGASVLFQPLGDDILWLLPLNAVTWPWKPGTIEVINANAGCSGKYPNACTP